MLFFLPNKDECEGCQERAEIMGAGDWINEALVVGGVLLVLLLLVFLKK